MHRIASIDLGTNTCNLVITDIIDNKFITVLSERRVVKLLSDNGDNSAIGDQAIERCVNAFVDYRKIIDTYKANSIIAYATSGLRNASNSSYIIDEIYKKSKIQTQIIDGLKEADLIYKGVTAAIQPKEETFLLLDIGGGSNEFIACDKSGILFSHSFEIGIARLLTMYEFEDPLSVQNIETVEKVFSTTLLPLINNSKGLKFASLVGSSGTFETLALIYRHMTNMDIANNQAINIPITDFSKIFDLILGSTFEERKLIKGMDLMRIEMIPLAILLVQFVIKTFNIKSIKYSKYSLKEGAIIDNYIDKKQQ